MFFQYNKSTVSGLILPSLLVFIAGCGDSDKLIFQTQDFEVKNELLETSLPAEANGIAMSVPKGFIPASDSLKDLVNLSVENQPEGAKYHVLAAFIDSKHDDRLLLVSEITSVVGMFGKFQKFVKQYEENWVKVAPDAKTATFSNGNVNLWQSKRKLSQNMHIRWLIDSEGTKAPVQIDLIYLASENEEMEPAIESMIGSITTKEK